MWEVWRHSVTYKVEKKSGKAYIYYECKNLGKRAARLPSHRTYYQTV